MGDDEYFEPEDTGPDEFKELDELVEMAKFSTARKDDRYPKYDARIQMIELMADEVDPGDIRVYQQMGRSWVTEVLYKGITFITFTDYKPDWSKEE